MNLDDHACATGDCAHKRQHQCSETLIAFSKDEIQKRDKLLEQAKPWMEGMAHRNSSPNLYVHWLKDFEELKNE